MVVVRSECDPAFGKDGDCPAREPHTSQLVHLRQDPGSVSASESKDGPKLEPCGKSRPQIS